MYTNYFPFIIIMKGKILFLESTVIDLVDHGVALLSEL